MTAATINTSHSQRIKYQLRLSDRTSSEHHEFDLYEKTDSIAYFELAHEGAVHESHTYEVALLANKSINLETVTLSVNDDEPTPINIGKTDITTKGTEGDELFCYQLLPNQNKIFEQAYGFALVKITLELVDDISLILTTNSIACFCDNQDQESVISKMIDELAFGDRSEAISLMLTPEHCSQEGFSLIDSNRVADGSESLKSFLSYVKKFSKFTNLIFPFLDLMLIAE